MDRNADNGICLALGFFDCMHVGHRAIMSAATDFARLSGCETVVLTFSSSPKIFGGDGKSIYTFAERKQIYSECGADRVIALDFDEKTQRTSPEDFLNRIFSEENVKAVFCGEDYRFGNRGAGNAELLKRYCVARGAQAVVVPIVTTDGEKVSSTRIRSLLENGNIEEANKFLIVPYRITAEVISGRGDGRKFGFPTANVRLCDDKVYPAPGVYATKIKIADKTYFGATNVGKKPTFGDDSVSVETFIDGFDGDLYGEMITLFFTRRLRAIEKFSSPEALAERIRADVREGEKTCSE